MDGIGEDEYQQMQNMIQSHRNDNDMGGFDDTLQNESIPQASRNWYEEGRLAGFAYVDDFNNLWFQTAPGQPNHNLESDIICWAMDILRERNRKSERCDSLNANCSGNHIERIRILEKNGFTQKREKIVYYSRSLDEPIPILPFPTGYIRRCVSGEEEAGALAELFCAANGTNNMTTEDRLAMMRTGGYRPDLDWVALSSNGELAAYCTGGFDKDSDSMSILDPVGTHPRHQRKGLAAAMMSAGMNDLKKLGASSVSFSTGSENLAMQQLGKALGFRVTGEAVWFERAVI